MFSADQYELLDFGNARKLERFAAIIVDRPAPGAANDQCARPTLWSQAHARYEAARTAAGTWRRQAEIPEAWRIADRSVVFELRLTDSGQVGIFPEQAPQWSWIARQIASARRHGRILNLFAYTGGSTLTAASQTTETEIVHVDASRTAVRWARRNATLSGLADRRVRWIIEDVQTFVDRELKRGNRYHAILLDPPSFGRGPRGQPWKLDDHLPSLLKRCGELLADSAAFLLVTCHTPGWEPSRLADSLRDNLPKGRIEAGAMAIPCADHRQLPSGSFARWTSGVQNGAA